MTFEEAKAAANSRAFVKWNPKDGRGGWIYGRAAELRGDYLYCRANGSDQDHRIHYREVKPNNSVNSTNGITLATGPTLKKNGTGRIETEWFDGRGDFVIRTPDRQYYTGSGFSPDPNRAHIFKQAKKAQEVADRTRDNGGTFCEIIPHESVLEELTEPPAPAPTSVDEDTEKPRRKVKSLPTELTGQSIDAASTKNAQLAAAEMELSKLQLAEAEAEDALRRARAARQRGEEKRDNLKVEMASILDQLKRLLTS